MSLKSTNAGRGPVKTMARASMNSMAIGATVHSAGTVHYMLFFVVIICDLFVYENFAGIKISRVFFKMPCPTPFYML